MLDYLYKQDALYPKNHASKLTPASAPFFLFKIWGFINLNGVHWFKSLGQSLDFKKSRLFNFLLKLSPQELMYRILFYFFSYFLFNVKVKVINKIMKIVLFDISAFTLILPLFPALIAHYRENDSSGLFQFLENKASSPPS